uniref:Uncharacterized protein n=1 Tax=Phakopsora pachyrhizi TaxID=170000 RepID=A0A0S1MII6_PHAPC
MNYLIILCCAFFYVGANRIYVLDLSGWLLSPEQKEGTKNEPGHTQT